jgi:hypothetical protein
MTAMPMDGGGTNVLLKGFCFLRLLHQWGDELWVHERWGGRERVTSQLPARRCCMSCTPTAHREWDKNKLINK